ncbi:transposase zinc-binding domain-containing protein [Francisella adeliensis]|uniref:transposase zinc-binding domain-containing protein n=1 Tax=Francisella adeliensis TaxID=2007306 RepID=UPI003905A23A
MKDLFQKSKAWLKYYEANKHNIRDAEVENVVKITGCGLQVCGFILYRCSNRTCMHTKRICFSCNSRSCPTCGKRAIDHWAEKSPNLFPDCTYQHITFTMPDVL